MFVNAILEQEVLVFDENAAKIYCEDIFVVPSSELPASSFDRDKVGSGISGIEFRLMSELNRPDDTSANSTLNAPLKTKSEMFADKPPEGGGIPLMAWMVAGLAVLVVIGVLVMMGRHKTAAPTTLQPLAAYAGNLPLSQLAMSESTSLSGGKSTFVDGHVQNTGAQTVTGITVQVVFRNEEAMPPQIETLPMALIRTREPYVDIQPVGAAPLKPGDERDFRLIFESIPTNWNGQMPEIRIISVEAK
jgi:hypothetical protein